MDRTNNNLFPILEKPDVSLNDKPCIIFWCKVCLTLIHGSTKLPFCFCFMCRSDKAFVTALGLYLGDGLKSDMDTVRNGGTVLEGMQTLLASTSTSLIT